MYSNTFYYIWKIEGLGPFFFSLQLSKTKGSDSKVSSEIQRLSTTSCNDLTSPQFLHRSVHPSAVEPLCYLYAKVTTDVGYKEMQRLVAEL